MPRLLALRLGNLAGELIGNFVEFRLGHFQLLRVVAEHAVRRALDAAFQFIDARARASARLRGLREIALVDHVLGEIHGLTRAFAFGIFIQPVEEILGQHTLAEQFLFRFLHRVRIVLTELAHAVVKLAREERLGVFGLLGNLLGSFGELGCALFLLGELIEQFLAIRGFVQRLPLLFSTESIQLLTDFFLFTGKLAGVLAHPAEILGKLTGILFPHLFAQFLELALRARAGGERLRHRALGGGIGCLLNIIARLVELLLFIRHAGLIFRPLHPLAHLIHISEHLLLFLLETFEATFDVLFLLLSLRLLQRGLQFLHAFVQILLTAGQLLEPVHHL